MNVDRTLFVVHSISSFSDDVDDVEKRLVCGDCEWRSRNAGLMFFANSCCTAAEFLLLIALVVVVVVENADAKM